MTRKHLPPRRIPYPPKRVVLFNLRETHYQLLRDKRRSVKSRKRERTGKCSVCEELVKVSELMSVIEEAWSYVAESSCGGAKIDAALIKSETRELINMAIRIVEFAIRTIEPERAQVEQK